MGIGKVPKLDFSDISDMPEPPVDKIVTEEAKKQLIENPPIPPATFEKTKPEKKAKAKKKSDKKKISWFNKDKKVKQTQSLKEDDHQRRYAHYLDGMKRKMDKEVRDRHEHLSNIEQELDVRARKLTDMEKGIMEKEFDMLNEKKQYEQIKKLEQQLADKEITLNYQKQEMDRLSKELEEQKEQVQTLTQTVEQDNQETQHFEEMIDKEESIIANQEEKNKELETAEHTIDQLREQLQLHEDAISYLGEEREKVEQKLQERLGVDKQEMDALAATSEQEVNKAQSQIKTDQDAIAYLQEIQEKTEHQHENIIDKLEEEIKKEQEHTHEIEDEFAKEKEILRKQIAELTEQITHEDSALDMLAEQAEPVKEFSKRLDAESPQHIPHSLEEQQAFVDQQLDDLTPEPSLNEQLETFMSQCTIALRDGDRAIAAQLYSEIRNIYMQIRQEQGEDTVLYHKILDIYHELSV